MYPYLPQTATLTKTHRWFKNVQTSDILQPPIQLLFASMTGRIVISLLICLSGKACTGVCFYPLQIVPNKLTDLFLRATVETVSAAEPL